jgi:hypothetical protein
MEAHTEPRPVSPSPLRAIPRDERAARAVSGGSTGWAVDKSPHEERDPHTDPDRSMTTTNENAVQGVERYVTKADIAAHYAMSIR